MLAAVERSVATAVSPELLLLVIYINKGKQMLPFIYIFFKTYYATAVFD
jgi:hypothetical protein